LCKALTLISASIHNVRSFALWRNGSDPSGLRFAVPEEESFRGPLGRFPGIGSANMDGVVLKDDVRVFERRELDDELIRASAACGVPRLPQAAGSGEGARAVCVCGRHLP
jgi:hypothetical protein